MNGMKRYGRNGCCCDEECYREWNWREALSIVGKQYYPDPQSNLGKMLKEIEVPVQTAAD